MIGNIMIKFMTSLYYKVVFLSILIYIEHVVYKRTRGGSGSSRGDGENQHTLSQLKYKVALGL